jgi:membrane-associated phospholipid phosphatase
MWNPDAWLTAAAWAGSHALIGFVVLLAIALAAAWIGHGLYCGRVRARSPTDMLNARALILRLAIGLGIILFCASMFAQLAEHLHAGVFIGRADEAFMQALIQTRVPEAVLSGFHVLTFFGDSHTLTVLTVIVALALWLRSQHGLALGWTLALAGNGLLNPTLKRLFERARPTHPTALVTEEGFSFPSGHSSGAVVAYGMLAYLALRLLPRRWHRPALAAAVALVCCIGASRVFLGVHFPSDVIAGLLSGTAWLLVCISSIELASWYRARARRAIDSRS